MPSWRDWRAHRMSRPRATGLRCVLALSLSMLWLVSAPVCTGQERPTPPAEAAGSPAVLEALRRRVQTLEEELTRLQAQQTPRGAAGTLLLCDPPHVGDLNIAGKMSRFIAIYVRMYNPGKQPIIVSRDQLTLLVSGEPRPLAEPPKDWPQRVQVADAFIPANELTFPRETRLAPGMAAGGWLLVTDVPQQAPLPEVVVRLKRGDVVEELSITAQQREDLGLTVQQLGPKYNVAIVGISGTLTTFNLPDLIDAIDRAAAVSPRVILHFHPNASPPNMLLMNSLRTAAINPTPSRVTLATSYRNLSAALSEFHLAGLPKPPLGPQTVSDHEKTRIHPDLLDALVQLLRTYFEGLPRGQRWEEINAGPTPLRAAALQVLGGTLDETRLPALLKLADDPEPLIQQAAVQTLRHFEQPEAIEKLAALALRDAPPLAPLAVESLAASRYPAANQALVKLFEQADPATQLKYVSTMKTFAKPAWSEPLYQQFQQRNDPGLFAALIVVGHPRMVEILETVLASGTPTHQQLALTALIDRREARCDELALQFTLKHLADSPPLAVMQPLVERTRDPRLLPLLQRHLEADERRSVTIAMLLVVGDEAMLKRLSDQYSVYNPQDQVAVLQGLRRRRSPLFFDLLPLAVRSQLPMLHSAAIQGTYEDGQADAMKRFEDAVALPETNVALVCQGLRMSNFPAAHRLLRRLCFSTDIQRRQPALAQYQGLLRRSPAFDSYQQGMAHLQRKDYDAAEISMKQAVQLDAKFADAHVSLGQIYIHQAKAELAVREYELAVELDPENMNAYCGIAIGKAMAGRIDEGLAGVEALRERYGQNGLFLYDVACAYSRAIERLRTEPATDARAEKIAAYQRRAVVDLTASLTKGYEDLKWMREDPDLKALHDYPDFRQVAQFPD